MSKDSVTTRRGKVWLEKRSGIWVTVFKGQGCAPSTETEKYFWRKLCRMKRQ